MTFMLNPQNSRVTEWVHLCEQWCEPDWTHWCDGSPRELAGLMKNETFVAVSQPIVGEKCVSPGEAIAQIAANCRGSVRGKILYIVPYILGIDDVGVLITDRPARAAYLHCTARIGAEALALLDTGCEFTAQLLLCGSDGGDNNADRINIRCHLAGPAITDTACRIGDRRRLNLPMETSARLSSNGTTCQDCQRLCPNRARALVTK